MSDQNYDYPPPSFGQNYGQQSSNYDNDYQDGSYRGGYNKGGNFGNRNNRGGYNKGDNMVTQDDTVFVSGMDPEVNETEINNHFGAIGIIKKDKRTNKPKIWIYRDKESGQGKGECTITYDDPAAASGAIQWFDGKEMNGNVIKVQLAQRNNTWQKGGPKKSFGPPGGGRGGFGGSRDDNRGGDRQDRGNRGGGFGGSSRGDRNSGGNSRGVQREGDWTCSECNNTNFRWRNECNRCNAPKSDDGSRSSGGDRSGGSGGRFQSRNDGNRNFSRGGMRGGDRPSGGYNRQRPY